MYPGALFTASPPPPQVLQLPLGPLLLPAHIRDMGRKGGPCAQVLGWTWANTVSSLAWLYTSCNFGQSTSSLVFSPAVGPPNNSARHTLQINSSGGNQVSPVSLRLKQTYNAVSMLNNVSLWGAVTASSSACIGEECDCSLSFPTDPWNHIGLFFSCLFLLY